MSGATRRPSAPDNASPRNRRESAVVDLLIDRLADRLGDRSGVRHAPPWEPKQNVLLGVLEPIWVHPPAVTAGENSAENGDSDAGETSDTAETEKATTPLGEIPSLGVDFRVRADGAEKVMLTVDLAFALYLEEIATLDEQRTYLGAPGQAQTSTGKGEGTGGETDPSTAHPTDGHIRQGDAEPNDVAEDQSADSAASGSDTPGDSGQGTTRRRRERKTRLLGAWRRHDVSVSELRIEVSTNGTVETVSTLSTDQCAPSSTGITRNLTPCGHSRLSATSCPEPHSPMRSRSAPRSTLQLDRTWQPAYPNLELTAFAQPLGGGEYLVSVSLRNVTQLSDRTLQDVSVYDCQLSVLPDAATPLVAQRFELAPDDYRLTDLADVVGHGTGCVALPAESGGIRSETLPTFTQPVVEPRDDHVAAPRWADLARDPAPILTSIQVAMEDFERDFRSS